MRQEARLAFQQALNTFDDLRTGPLGSVDEPVYHGFPTGTPSIPGPGDETGSPGNGTGTDTDETLAVLLPLLILLCTLLLLLLVFLLFLIILRRKRGIVLRDEGGPTNVEHEDELEGEGGLSGIEQRWLEGAEETTKVGYMRAKVWQSQYPPNSQPTDITLSQFLSIQEKGVSAWSFEPDYESNPALIVQSRTEITFLSDGVGMAEEEGGGCCVQSNLPLPKLNEVYYWECKMYDKPAGTTVSIGLATKPFPSFRLPGWSKYSVGYFSSDGFKSHSYPFTAQSYGPPLTEGDVLGVGYRPRTGTVFFTRNGKKLEDAFVGMNRHNLFPTVGANAACTIHVNLGQAGFVFIEANVKKWGLAPMMGTLAPPPAYGSERGSILLESAGAGGTSGGATSNLVTPPRRGSGNEDRDRTPRNNRHKNRRRDPPPAFSASTSTATSHAGAASALGSPSSSQPIRPSPLRHSRQASNLSNMSSRSNSSNSNNNVIGEEDELDEIQNPPTPGLLDISLHSLHRFPQEMRSDDSDEEGQERERRRVRTESSGSSEGASEEDDERTPTRPNRTSSIPVASSSTGAAPNVSPPAYNPIDPHVYAPGVAEAIWEDAFSHVANRQNAPRFPQNLPPPTRSQQDNFSNASSFSDGRYEGNSSRNGGGGWFSWLGGGSGSATPAAQPTPPPAGRGNGENAV